MEVILAFGLGLVAAEAAPRPTPAPTTFTPKDYHQSAIVRSIHRYPHYGEEDEFDPTGAYIEGLMVSDM